jgi:hypothetical protein
VGGFEPHLLYAEPACQILKLAGRALWAGGAALVMVCQKQLHGNLSYLANLFRFGFNHHARRGDGGAGGDYPPAFHIHQTEPARAVHGQIGVVAEGGNIYPGLADYLKQVPLALYGYFSSVNS